MTLNHVHLKYHLIPLHLFRISAADCSIQNDKTINSVVYSNVALLLKRFSLLDFFFVKCVYSRWFGPLRLVAGLLEDNEKILGL